MKSLKAIVATVVLFIAVAVQAQTASTKPLPQRADVAAPKMNSTTQPNPRFMTMHEKFVEQAKAGNIDLLFLGDSITEGWMGRGKDVWQKSYGDKHAANFGISGDKTQHVLWRIENGELENIHPKVCVLMIGTNNVGSNPPEQIAAGVENIVKSVRDKTGAKVLLLAVFPRGKNPQDPKVVTARAVLDKVNAQIAKMDDGSNIRYLDIGEKFLEPDKSISPEIMPDALHPNAKGYEIWAEAMNPLLTEMLK